MRIGWACGLMVGIATLLVACSSSPPESRHTPTSAPSSSQSIIPTVTPTPASTPVLTTLSAADLAGMATAYVSYMDSLKAGLFAPGSVAVHQSHAALMPTGSEWALADMGLNPGPSPTAQEQAALDGAGAAVYFRVAPNTPWLLRGLATEPTCTSLPHVGVPPTVAALWDMSETCGG